MYRVSSHITPHGGTQYIALARPQVDRLYVDLKASVRPIESMFVKPYWRYPDTVQRYAFLASRAACEGVPNVIHITVDTVLCS